MTILAQFNDCHSCNDARSMVQKRNGSLVVWCFLVVFLWQCFCGSVLEVVFFCWCGGFFCGGVFVVVLSRFFCGGVVVFSVVVFLWYDSGVFGWCRGVFCGGVFVVVFLRRCGGLFAAVFL